MKQTLATKVVGWTAIALGLATVAIWPKGSISSERTVVISCTTKKLYINGSAFKEEGFKPGIYTSDEYVDVAYEKALDEYKTSLAGNPFMGLGLSLMEALRPRMTEIMETSVEEICDGTAPADTTVGKLVESLNNIGID